MLIIPSLAVAAFSRPIIISFIKDVYIPYHDFQIRRNSNRDYILAVFSHGFLSVVS
jgi:hypothetical protein